MSNAYLQAKRTRLNELHTEVEEAQNDAHRNGRDLTEGELTEMHAKAEQAKQIHDEIVPLLEDEQRAKQVGAMASEVLGASAGMSAGDAISPLMPSQDQMLQIARSSREGNSTRVSTRAASADDEQMRATVTTTETGIPAQGVGQLLREPRRLAVTAQLPVERVQGASDAPFPVYGAGSAGTAAEGTLKTEYAAVTAGNARPETIAVWTDYSRQVEWSWPNWEQRLRGKLATLIARSEDDLLVTNVLGTVGIQTLDHSTLTVPRSESLLEAAGMVLGGQASAAPNVAVVNQADVRSIFGGSFGTSGETPEEALRLALHGMAVYVSPAVASGSALVGAWPDSAKFVDGLGGVQYIVDAVSGIKNNIITLLAEEAVNVAVQEPEGFVDVTFSP